MRTSRCAATIGSAALMVSALVAASSVSGTALAATGSHAVAVPGDLPATALPGAKVFGKTPADTPETVSFVLTERDLAPLERAVTAGIPDASYLSVGQFAASHGQTSADIHRLVAYLAGYGINSTIYADDVDLVATGTAGAFDEALDVTQMQYRVPARPAAEGMQAIPAQTVHGSATPAMLPADIASYVTAVLGLLDYTAATSASAHAPSSGSAVAGRDATAVDCHTLTGLPDACHLPSGFAEQYDLDPLYRSGTGKGETLGIVTLAAVDPGAPQYFWQHYADVPYGADRVAVDDVDGGPGPASNASDSEETDIDVEQSGAVAPGAHVIVYQSPNTDFGWADSFFTAASQDVASTVSSSWISSETEIQAIIDAGEESPGWVAAFDEAFLELAAQGQSTFLCSADYGAYGAQQDLGTTNLTVDSPPDSPYATAAGGTTLAWSGTLTGKDGSATVTVPAQRAWGWDYLWAPLAKIDGLPLATVAESRVIGSGGGFSVLEPTPSYQRGVAGTSTYDAVPYLTPVDFEEVAPGLGEPTGWRFQADPPVVSGTGTGRAVPDLSTDADPYSGYLLYAPSFAGADEPILQGGWGGTSFVAPELNGAAAVIDSVVGHRVGFWNPVMYAAAEGPGSPFDGLEAAGTGSDNLYYTGQLGDVYNQAVGLGVPDLARLEAVLDSSGE